LQPTYLTSTGGRYRYDRIYVSDSLLPYSTPSRVQQTTLSDHSAVLFSVNLFELSKVPPPSRWILSKDLLSSNTYTQNITDLLLSANIHSVPDFNYLMSKIGDYSKVAQANFVKRKKKARSLLKKQSVAAFDLYTASPTPENLALSALAAAKYESSVKDLADLFCSASTISWDKGKELPSAFLTSVTKQKGNSKCINT
jgi:hypothetical protein